MERINIVTACDEAFAKHNCVLLASLFSHNPALVFNIFVIVSKSFSAESRLKIRNSLPLGNSALYFCTLDAGVTLPDVPVGCPVTEATYYRFLLAEILPSSASLALYLDSDIIINGDISELISMDLSHHAIGAIPDAWADSDAPTRKKIGLRKDAHYVNAGVLLINLDLWRSRNIGRRVIEYCASNPDVNFLDQCALNHVMQGDCKIFDKKWNFQTSHLQNVTEHEVKSAVIIHFTKTDSKPWHFTCTHPLKHLYFMHLRSTLWKPWHFSYTHPLIQLYFMHLRGELWRIFTEKNLTAGAYIKNKLGFL